MATSRSSGGSFSHPALSTPEQRPQGSFVAGRILARVRAPHGPNVKDEMEVFSPLVEVQPITPTLNDFWNVHDNPKKELDGEPSDLFSLKGHPPSEEKGIQHLRSSSMYKQDGIRSSLSQFAAASVSTPGVQPSSLSRSECRIDQQLSEKFTRTHQSSYVPSRFAVESSSLSSGSNLSGPQHDNLSSQSMNILTTSSLRIPKMRVTETANPVTSEYSEHVNSSPGAKGIGQDNVDSPGSPFFLARKLSSCAEKRSSMPAFSDPTSFPLGSPKIKKSGEETTGSSILAFSDPTSFSLGSPKIKKSGEETTGSSMPAFSDPTSFSLGSPKIKKRGEETTGKHFSSYLSKSDVLSALTMGIPPSIDSGASQSWKVPSLSESQRDTSFSLHLFQRTLDQTLESFQRSIHEDVRNLHIEILRQFHMQEMEMSHVVRLILENQAEIVKQIQSLTKETRRLSRLL